MTSSTWISEAPGALIGCGIDCESTGRFEALLARDPHPLPSVFTAREIESALSLPEPARALCAAFCAKEATVKALGAPFDLTACELVDRGPDGGFDLVLAEALRRERGIRSASAVVREEPGAPGEILVVVQLYA